MPKALRPMKSNGNPPLPIVGDGAKYLCVRNKDLPPDSDGNAVPDQGGLSVVSSMQGLRIRSSGGSFRQRWFSAAWRTKESYREPLGQMILSYLRLEMERLKTG